MSHPTKDQLRKALEIQEKIEGLQTELEQILQGISSSLPTVPTTEKQRGRPKAADTSTPAKRGPKPGSKRGPRGRRAAKAPTAPGADKPAPRKRSVSPSGPLGPAVVAVLERAGRPLKAREIFNALNEDNYQWTNSNPMPNLSARLYTLPQLEKVGSGLFQLRAAESAIPQQPQQEQ